MKKNIHIHSSNPQQDTLSSKQKIKSFDLQYHKRIQKVEIDRRKCTIQNILFKDLSQVNENMQNVIIQPKLYRSSNDLSLTFETQLQFPNQSTEVVMDDIKIILRDISQNNENEISQNKYENGQYITLIKINPNQFLWKIESFVVDVKIISKQKKNINCYKQQEEYLLVSKTTFISNYLRESLLIKNSLRTQKKTFTTCLSLMFYEAETFDLKTYKSLLVKRRNEYAHKKSSKGATALINSQHSNRSCQQVIQEDEELQLEQTLLTRKKSSLEELKVDQENLNDAIQNKIEKLACFSPVSNITQEENDKIQEEDQDSSIPLQDITNMKKQDKNILNSKNQKLQGDILDKTQIQESQKNIDATQLKQQQQQQVSETDENECQQSIQQNILSKKNVVKNIVKAFQRYLKSIEFKFEIINILNKKIPEEYDQFLKKYMNFEKKKSYNNNLIKILMQNEEYSSIFKYFIQNRAKQMVQSSNVSDKNSHYLVIEKYIDALQKPQYLDDIISTRKKRQKGRKKLKQQLLM